MFQQSIENLSFGEYKSTRNHLGSGKYSAIRYQARRSCKDRLQCCESCGWKEHVEVCHKKPIKDFSDDALISEINADDNLI